MRKSMNVIAALLLVGAGAAAQTSPSGLVDMGEFKDREDCLYREVGKSIKTQDRDTDPDEVAKAAAQLCGQAVRARLMRLSPSIAHGEELVRYDRLQTELRALAIARELREKGSR
jgi:hypothetical protein